MNSDQFFALTIIAIGAVTTLTMVRMWVNRRRGGDAPDKRLSEIESRLERLQQAVDSIAIETERISEGQRFTTRLLTDRSREEAGVPDARR
jgi:hypothetical protein